MGNYIPSSLARSTQDTELSLLTRKEWHPSSLDTGPGTLGIGKKKKAAEVSLRRHQACPPSSGGHTPPGTIVHPSTFRRQSGAARKEWSADIH